MTDAPERLWIDPDASLQARGYTRAYLKGGDRDDVEYVRADLCSVPTGGIQPPLLQDPAVVNCPCDRIDPIEPPSVPNQGTEQWPMEVWRDVMSTASQQLHRARLTEAPDEALPLVQDTIRQLRALTPECSSPTGGLEPVAYTGSGSLAAITAGRDGFIWGERADAHPVPLYADPRHVPDRGTIKPLEWDRASNGTARADSPVGTYIVNHNGRSWWVVLPDHETTTPHETEAEAYSDAEGHYAARVASCFRSMPNQGVEQGLRERILAILDGDEGFVVAHAWSQSKPTKYDRCVHGWSRSEGCPACVDAAIRAACSTLDRGPSVPAQEQQDQAPAEAGSPVDAARGEAPGGR